MGCESPGSKPRCLIGPPSGSRTSRRASRCLKYFTVTYHTLQSSIFLSSCFMTAFMFESDIFKLSIWSERTVILITAMRSKDMDRIKSKFCRIASRYVKTKNKNVVSSVKLVMFNCTFYGGFPHTLESQLLIWRAS